MTAFLQRVARATLVIVSLATLAATNARAQKPAPTVRRTRGLLPRVGFQLFSGSGAAMVRANRVRCGLTDAGQGKNWTDTDDGVARR